MPTSTCSLPGNLHNTPAVLISIRTKLYLTVVVLRVRVHYLLYSEPIHRKNLYNDESDDPDFAPQVETVSRVVRNFCVLLLRWNDGRWQRPYIGRDHAKRCSIARTRQITEPQGNTIQRIGRDEQRVEAVELTAAALCAVHGAGSTAAAPPAGHNEHNEPGRC